MTTGDNTAAELVRILGEHWYGHYPAQCGCGFTNYIPSTGMIVGGMSTTTASYVSLSIDQHREHVASVLSGWVRQQQAGAWREGYEDGKEDETSAYWDRRPHETPNPYEDGADT
jgi:hypothetical protein